MKYIFVLILALVEVCSGAEDSKHILISKVLVEMDAKGSLEKMRAQNVELVNRSLLSQKGEYADNPLMKRLIARVMQKYEAYTRERMGWARWEPKYVEVYDELYTEAQLQGLLEFLRSDAGRALARATPILAGRMQSNMLQQQATAEAKVAQMMQETISEVQAEVEAEQANQALEPTATGVTPAADAPVAPPSAVAHH